MILVNERPANRRVVPMEELNVVDTTLGSGSSRNAKAPKQWRPPLGDWNRPRQWTPATLMTAGADRRFGTALQHDRVGKVRPLVLLTDMDEVHFRIGTWQEPFFVEMPELDYRPKPGYSFDIFMSEQAQYRNNERKRLGSQFDGHQANTEFFLSKITDGTLPLNREVVEYAGRLHRERNVFRNSPETLTQAFWLVDMISRTDRTDPTTSTARLFNVVDSCGMASSLQPAFEHVPFDAIAAQELTYDDRGNVTGFIGIAFDEDGNPRATPGRVFGNRGKAQFAAWIMREFGLDASQICYLFDGETDQETVELVLNSIQMYPTESDFSLQKSRETFKNRPLFTLDNRPRYHPKPVPALFGSRSSLNEWVSWADGVADALTQRYFEKAAATGASGPDCNLAEPDLLRIDMDGAPNDEPGRYSILRYACLEAAITRQMMLTGLSRVAFGPLDLTLDRSCSRWADVTGAPLALTFAPV